MIIHQEKQRWEKGKKFSCPDMTEQTKRDIEKMNKFIEQNDTIDLKFKHIPQFILILLLQYKA